MVPTEYVAYVDNYEMSVSPYDLAVVYYPTRLKPLYELGSSGETVFHSDSVDEPSGVGTYLYYLTDNVVVSGGVRLPIYALRCLEYNSTDIANAVTTYYFYHQSFPVALGPYLTLVPQSMIDSINSSSNPLEDPFTGYTDSGDLAYNQDSIFSWLYNLGANIISNDLVSDLLSFKVGDYNLISLLIQSGFMIYVGWVIAKWVIP